MFPHSLIPRRGVSAIIPWRNALRWGRNTVRTGARWSFRPFPSKEIKVLPISIIHMPSATIHLRAICLSIGIRCIIWPAHWKPSWTWERKQHKKHQVQVSRIVIIHKKAMHICMSCLLSAPLWFPWRYVAMLRCSSDSYDVNERREHQTCFQLHYVKPKADTYRLKATRAHRSLISLSTSSTGPYRSISCRRKKWGKSQPHSLDFPDQI